MMSCSCCSHARLSRESLRDALRDGAETALQGGGIVPLA